MQASANRAAREQEREYRRVLKEQERLQKKIEKVIEKKEKIKEALNDHFAKGKIDQSDYNTLLKREDDIGEDLLVFGKTPIVSVAKRYICGKIDKKEFDDICLSIIGSSIFEEKEDIKLQYEKRVSDIDSFVGACNKELEGMCQKCSKKKSFFGPIKEFSGVKLCKSCRNELKDLMSYSGYDGNYYYASPHEIVLADKNPVIIGIHNHHL